MPDVYTPALCDAADIVLEMDSGEESDKLQQCVVVNVLNKTLFGQIGMKLYIYMHLYIYILTFLKHFCYQINPSFSSDPITKYRDRRLLNSFQEFYPQSLLFQSVRLRKGPFTQ